jgi:phage recombination protein Bet
MNQIATREQRPMLLASMAEKAGLQPQEFANTVRATCGMVKATAEEFAAFLLVAREYNLNPLTKEIYAFPAKGGGIVPIVSIDGWVNLVNSHPACDGFEFDVEHDSEGELVAITCKMYRNDRSRPVVVTEYYEECKRPTDPWKMKHRMLRHKAMIQAARYAFGFSGIYDEDEGARFADMRDVTPTPPTPPTPPKPPAPQEGGPAPTEGEDSRNAPIDGDIIDPDTGEVSDEENGDTAFFERLEADMDEADDEASIEEIWTEADPMARFESDETNQSIALAIKSRALKRVGGKK